MTKAGGHRTGVLRGAVLTVGMRWLSRLIGIISTLILARLLLPDDFGVTAMASVVLGLVSVLLDLGVNVALIRNPAPTPAHFHAAWTLRIAQALVVALVLLALAPFAGDYFRDPRVTPVLMVMSLTVLISSFENIGVIGFQKEMQFGLEFRYLLANRLFGFVCAVGAAFVLRSYWALVFGGLVSAVFNVANSYRAHPMRPRLSTDKLREIFGVSQWMLVQNIGAYLDDSVHKLAVGRREDTATMGGYSLAAEIAAMPSTELLQPLNRVLFPAFVAAKHDLAQLKRTFLLAQGIQVLVALPAAVFLAYLAHDVVALLLGEKWVAAAPLLQTLAIGSALLAFRSSAWYVAVTLGKERQSAIVMWLQVVLFCGALLALVPGAGAQGIAQLRVVVPAVGLLLQLWIVGRALGSLSVWDVVAGVWRPVVSTAVPIAVLSLMPLPVLGPLVAVLTYGFVCVGFYVICLHLLWRISGRPDGAESYLIGVAQQAVAKMKGPG